MRDLLEYLLREITGNSNFEISEETSDDRLIFTVKADSEDMGLLIGKEGRTIKSIQDIMRIRGKLDNSAVFVDIASKE